jgi:hypothetical protein
MAGQRQTPPLHLDEAKIDEGIPLEVAATKLQLAPYLYRRSPKPADYRMRVRLAVSSSA